MFTPALAQALAKAHGTFGYDVLALMPEEKKWLEDNDAIAPTPATVIDSRVQAVTVPVAGGEVGFIILPKLQKNAKKPLDMTVRSISKLVESLHKRTKLVVAISPWGHLAEDHFLRNADNVPDIMLGAGPGPGIAGRFSRDGKIFWARTYGRGRALHVIRIAEWPTRDDGWKWVKDKNLRLDFRPLNESVATDPAMEDLLDEYDLPVLK